MIFGVNDSQWNKSASSQSYWTDHCSSLAWKLQACTSGCALEEDGLDDIFLLSSLCLVSSGDSVREWGSPCSCTFFAFCVHAIAPNCTCSILSCPVETRQDVTCRTCSNNACKAQILLVASRHARACDEPVSRVALVVTRVSRRAAQQAPKGPKFMGYIIDNISCHDVTPSWFWALWLSRPIVFSGRIYAPVI